VTVTVTHPLYLVLYLLALILFVLAMVNVTSKHNLVAAGLAAWVLVQVLTALSLG
jgi:hypothetical protein